MSVDRIPLPSTDGSLWVCALRDIADDPDAVVSWADASTVVCLNEAAELERRAAVYLGWLRANKGGRALWYPIRNFSAPPAATIVPFLRMITTRLGAGEGVIMHCAMGQGRAGTIAVCVLTMLGASLDDALETVAAHRLYAGPGEPSQWALVRGIADLAAP